MKDLAYFYKLNLEAALLPQPVEGRICPSLGGMGALQALASTPP
jgi:hypothetical protein